MAYFTKIAPKTEKWLYHVNKAAAWIASVALCVMVLITIVDVVGRYCFNKPLPGAWEIIGLLLVCAGTWAWGYCQMSKHHISVTVIIKRFSLRVQAIIRSFAYLVGFVGFSLICWQMFILAKEYFTMTQGNETLTMGVPFAPFMLMASISAGLMTLVLFIDLCHSLAEVVRR